MDKHYPHLMQPLQIGSITVKNRLAVAPLGTHRLYGPKGEYTDNAIE